MIIALFSYIKVKSNCFFCCCCCYKWGYTTIKINYNSLEFIRIQIKDYYK